MNFFRMTKGSDLLAGALIIGCICVYESFASCSDSSNDIVEAVLGRNIDLTCTSSLDCNTINWLNKTSSSPRFVEPDTTERTTIVKRGRTSVLSILSGVTLHDAGPYSCWCYVSGRPIETEGFCSVTLKTICQSTVLVNGKELIYNSSDESLNNILDIKRKDAAEIKCQDDAELNSNCSFHKDGERYKIELEHSCHASCVLKEGTSTTSESCTVDIYFQVDQTQLPVNSVTDVTSYTTSAGASSQSNGKSSVTRSPFPALLIPLIAIVTLLLLVAVALCLYIFMPRMNSSSNSNKISHSVKVKENEVILTYATVDKTKSVDVADSQISTVFGSSRDVDFYSEVDKAEAGQATGMQAVTDISEPTTNNLYSKVNKGHNDNAACYEASDEPGNLATNFEMYSEVSIEHEISKVNGKFGVPHEVKSRESYEKVTSYPAENQEATVAERCTVNKTDTANETLTAENSVNEDFGGLYAVVDKTKKKSKAT